MLSLIVAAVLAVLAGPASAAPVVALAAVAAASAAGATGLTLALVQLAAGIALALYQQDQARKNANQADLKRELARPDSLTPYRFIYGHVRAYGSPAPWRVKGDILFGCLIFNSRPSHGNFSLRIDQREMTLVGDPYDFAGEGAYGAERQFGARYLRVWIGRGDQTAPPAAILAEAPEIFRASDAWRGRTVLWVRLDCGDNDGRAERWPSVPPAIQMEGDWSLVWDPRDPGQKADDPDTWTFSRNRWLIVLDALRNNPIRKYPLRQLMMESIITAADVDDEPISLKAGGTEPRYRCDGLLTWDDSEIEEQIIPLVEAGAGGITRMGGRLGAIPGKWMGSDLRISDVLDDDGLMFEILKPGSDLATSVTVQYMSPDRGWELADAGAYDVPGAIAIDGGESTVKSLKLGFVTSPTQAQRMAKIVAMQQRAQRQLNCTLPPEAFRAVGGSVIDLAPPGDFAPLGGFYGVASIHPAMDIVGEQGVALRCPVELIEASPSVFAWDPATDEQDVKEAESIVATRKDIPAPAVIATGTGSSYAASSGPDRTRIKFWFAPVSSGRVASYEWQFRESGGSWQAGGTIGWDVRDRSDMVFGFLRPVEQGVSYDIRVRSRDGNSASVWTVRLATVALGPEITLDRPSQVSAVAGDGRITLSARLPSSDDVIGLEIWGVRSSGSSFALVFTLGGAPSSAVSVDHTGLSANDTWLYKARTRGPYNSVSEFSATVSALVA